MTNTPLEHVDHLVIGAGVTGLAFANFLQQRAADDGKPAPTVRVLEQASEPGGYCKTIEQDGFVWDYSGHFFHFRHKDIETYLTSRMRSDEVIRTVAKQTDILFGDGGEGSVHVDFPFQKNIHQLPREDFVECLHDLYFRGEGSADAPEGSFEAMLYTKLGRGIAEKFLIPYNEKLYACSMSELDADAMGRFFPHVDIDDVIRNMKQADNTSYNQTFTYPAGGAIQYIHALLKDLDDDVVCLDEGVVSIDLKAKVVTTTRRKLSFDRLVSSAPLPKLLDMCGLGHDEAAFTWNKVLVFNLGFDKKGPDNVHWRYFPDRSLRFYRVGFYDNIMSAPRMSLYVEIGADKDATFDVDAERDRVVADLKKAGVVEDHQLVSWHSVVLDPAYVHINKASMAETERTRKILETAGVYSAGRYGAWTYCSIEDNILEARELADRMAPLL
jgi:protoporphyrinogen oxidase